MKFEWLVLTSYIEVDTNSIFFQELIEPTQFEGTDHFADIEQGYEIESSPAEWEDFSQLPSPLALPGTRAISSIRLRSVLRGYHKEDIPAGGELFSLIYWGKGLAAFSMRESDDEELILDGQAFGKFVDAGTIHKRGIDLQIDGSVVKYLLFYSINQVWRADIYEQLKRHLAEASWTKYLEHIESIVLGYSETKE